MSRRLVLHHYLTQLAAGGPLIAPEFRAALTVQGDELSSTELGDALYQLCDKGVPRRVWITPEHRARVRQQWIRLRSSHAYTLAGPQGKGDVG